MDRKRVISWALYDWANSAFATTVMAGFFPIFFEKYWSNPNNINDSTFYLGLSNSAGSLIVAALAPFLGAIADRGSAKKKFLFMFAFLGRATENTAIHAHKHAPVHDIKRHAREQNLAN